MKLTMQPITEGEEEVIIRYRSRNAQIEAIEAIVKGLEQKLCVRWEDQMLFIKPEDILYIESVDGATYVYLENKVAKIDKSLAELEAVYETYGFFRCSKSMILNIYKFGHLKSEAGNRICSVGLIVTGWQPYYFLHSFCSATGVFILLIKSKGTLIRKI